jgi:hypothetical protein
MAEDLGLAGGLNEQDSPAVGSFNFAIGVFDFA